MSNNDIKIEGLADLDEVFRVIGPREARNAVRGSVFDVTRDIRKEARAQCPSKRVKKAIKAKRMRGRRGEERAAVVIAESGWIWRFLEMGTAPHVIKTKKRVLSDGVEHFGKMVEHPGMPAQPFLRPAYDIAAARLNTTYANMIGTRIIKQIERAAKKRSL